MSTTLVNKKRINSLAKEFNKLPRVVPSGIAIYRLRSGDYDRKELSFEPQDLTNAPLYSSLSVLSRDIFLYLNKNPREGAKLFKDVVVEVNKQERKIHGRKAFPDYEGLPTDKLPQKLAEKAAAGESVIDTLSKTEIVHEWTFIPGLRLTITFLKKMGPEFRKKMCGKNGLRAQFNSGILSQSGLITSIGSIILVVGLSNAPFWYPLAANLSLILAKKGLNYYCKSAL